MPDENDIPSDDDADEEVHLEWSYDLDRPFLAHVDLLSARPSYSTSLATEDGVFPVTMRLPTTPDDERGLANFLAPPHDWATTSREADEHWGTHYRDQMLGCKGVVVKRLAFTVHVHSALVDPAMRTELGPDLVAQQVLLTIDQWWENVRTWLEIATNQRLAQVGHEPSDWLNPNTRTSIWNRDATGRREELHIGGTVLVGPDRVISVTPEILQDCAALATTTPPLAWRLLRDARALQSADQLRRAVIDAATAAELAVTRRIDDLLASQRDPDRRKALKKASGLGGKTRALRDAGDELPPNFTRDLVDRRNDAVHEGTDVRYPEWEAAFGASLAIVERVFPLPTAPGSSSPLTCHWSRAAPPALLRPRWTTGAGESVHD